MPRGVRTVVFDSWAALAYLEDEPAAEAVADLIADARERQASLLMTVVTAGEVWYITARESSVADAERALDKLQELGCRFVDVDLPLTRAAAAFKAKHRMAYADCFAAALAKREKAELVTGDREFKQVEEELHLKFLG